jgi:hypothetical protein
MLAVPANYLYATLHFLVTSAELVLLYLARPGFYRRARSVLVGMMPLARTGYWFFPLAPPRLASGAGYLDPVHAFGVALTTERTGLRRRATAEATATPEP